MHIKDKVTTMSLGETSTWMFCYHYATGCQCGDKSLQTHAEHSGFTLPSSHLSLSFLFPLPLILLSPNPAHLSASRPHRLVVRVVGRPWPQALIGVEVHGVDFLPANLL